MQKLVLDTNSLIQILPKRSRYHDIWLSLFDGRNLLCVSNEILEEYEEILQRHLNNFLPDLTQGLLNKIRGVGVALLGYGKDKTCFCNK